MNFNIKMFKDAISATSKVIYDKYNDFKENESFNKQINREKENVNLLTQYYYFFSDPIHIIDNIYLGSAFNAACYYKLKESYNIKIIINVTKEISNYYPDDFTYKNYCLLDLNEDSIKDYLDDAYEFIEKNKNNNILIHCYMGASRSASILTYYIMKKYNVNYDVALSFIEEKRKIVNINSKFAQELNK